MKRIGLLLLTFTVLSYAAVGPTEAIDNKKAFAYVVKENVNSPAIDVVAHDYENVAVETGESIFIESPKEIYNDVIRAVDVKPPSQQANFNSVTNPKINHKLLPDIRRLWC